MPGNAKADVKFGFWAAGGAVLLLLLLGLLSRLFAGFGGVTRGG